LNTAYTDMTLTKDLPCVGNAYVARLFMFMSTNKISVLGKVLECSVYQIK